MNNKFDIINFNNKEIKRFSLEFNNRTLEKLFIHDYTKYSLNQNRFALILSVLSLTFFIFQDYFSVPELFSRFLFTRLTTITFLGIITIGLSFTKFHKALSYSILLYLFVTGMVINYFSMTTGFLVNSPYHYSLVLFFFFIFTLFRVPFRQVLFIAIAVLFLFEISLVTYGTVKKTDLFISNLHVIVSFITGIFAGYFIELYARKDFVQKNFLESENKRIIKSSSNLEEEVEKRTQDLLKMNKQLRKSKLRAEGSENLKTNFIANISHEIRTPLTRIIGFSELLAKANLPDEKRLKYSNILQENSDQLLRVISDMIELSKLQTDNIVIEKSMFNLKRFLESFESIFLELTAKYSKTHLRFSLDNFIVDEKTQINSDKNELRRVIINLLDNAIKFTNKGFVKLSCNVFSEDYLIFCVADTGIGIDKENQEFIFDHFRQVEDGATRSYGGVGVGLSISKEIIRNLEGDIWVESERKKGASFYFKIPYK